MKARPILFKPDMVRAILGGRKIQTRRVMKVQRPTENHQLLSIMSSTDRRKEGKSHWGVLDEGKTRILESDPRYFSCPYGAPGDVLWVREAWGIIDDNTVDAGAATYRATDPAALDKWRPSIHMPKWASRLTLEITDVRVERLQDISEEDAECEGVTPATPPEQTGARHKPAFRHLWEEINGVDSWVANPWVWVVEFQEHHMNVDAFLEGRS